MGSLIKEALNKLREVNIIDDEKVSNLSEYIQSKLTPDNQTYIINTLSIIINNTNTIIKRDKFNELIQYLK